VGMAPWHPHLSAAMTRLQPHVYGMDFTEVLGGVTPSKIASAENTDAPADV